MCSQEDWGLLLASELVEAVCVDPVCMCVCVCVCVCEWGRGEGMGG